MARVAPSVAQALAPALGPRGQMVAEQVSKYAPMAQQALEAVGAGTVGGRMIGGRMVGAGLTGGKMMSRRTLSSRAKR